MVDSNVVDKAEHDENEYQEHREQPDKILEGRRLQIELQEESEEQHALVECDGAFRCEDGYRILLQLEKEYLLYDA